MNIKMRDDGVSEIIGMMLLLAIAISSFSVIYYVVLSDQGPAPEIIANIVATVEGKNIILEHHGGESLNLDTEIIYTLNGTTYHTTVEESLAERAKGDDKWNIGERVIIPFEYDIDYLENYDKTEIMAVDKFTNALAFLGTIQLHPMSDVGIDVTIEPEKPGIGDFVTITVVATCLDGDVGARDIEIRCLLPEGLRHNWNQTTNKPGAYHNSSGIWSIDKIEIGDSETLIINATVVPIEARPFTQLAMVLDGSGSISNSDWDLMRKGLANAIENESVFPHDGSVELTVVQFGGDYDPWWGLYPHARREEGPVVVTDHNYHIIADNISLMSQMKGATPMGCGIRLGTDQIRDSGNFNEENRSVLCLVTDGLANGIWIPGGYTAQWDGNGWIKSTLQSHSGSTSASARYTDDGWFMTKDLDASNASLISVDFWYRLDNYCPWFATDLKIYYYNGNTYNEIAELGDDSPKRSWLHYHDIIMDSQYFVSNFRIAFESTLESGDEIWIDDVYIEADKVLLSDSFENTAWNVYWTDPGRMSAENARNYMLSTLNMTEGEDEFDALAVGPDPDIYWLNWSMVWPQPGYMAPPYDQGGGWVSHISGYSEFEAAMEEIFIIIFESRVTSVEIVALDPIDPNDTNDDIQIVIIPEDT